MNSITYHVLVDSFLAASGLDDRHEAIDVAKTWSRCFPNSDVTLIQSDSLGGFSIVCF